MMKCIPLMDQPCLPYSDNRTENPTRHLAAAEAAVAAAEVVEAAAAEAEAVAAAEAVITKVYKMLLSINM